MTILLSEYCTGATIRKKAVGAAFVVVVGLSAKIILPASAK